MYITYIYIYDNVIGPRARRQRPPCGPAMRTEFDLMICNIALSLYIYIYIYIYICMYIYIYMHVYVYIYIYIHLSQHMCIYIYIYVFDDMSCIV